MVQDRSVAIFYTSAICNLNCRYCAIDKNPALVAIDKELEESFNGDYYFDFCKDIFPDPNQLRRFETWGGEPFLYMDRIHYTLRKLFEHYPNFNEGFSSTNTLAPNFHEQFYRLMGVLGESNRLFTYTLQLSLDGPEWVNDRNRGLGTTKRIKASLTKLFNEVDEHLPDNVKLNLHFKPTLDMETIKELDSEEKIIAYYQFFEEFYREFEDVKHTKNIEFYPTKPNTACPQPHTTEDGKIFANFIKLCQNVQDNNETEHFFKYFTNITPYASNCVRQLDGNGGTCGTCRTIVGLLPNKMISGCHSAFVNVLEQYKIHVHEDESKHNKKILDTKMFIKDANNYFCFPYSELTKREQQIENFYKPNTTARLQGSATLIQLLAYAKQIDPKYKDVNEATKAANYISIACASCLNDNRAVTGTITLPQVGILRLLLNGADQYLIK